MVEREKRVVIAAIAPFTEDAANDAVETLLAANKGKYNPRRERLEEGLHGGAGETYAVHFAPRLKGQNRLRKPKKRKAVILQFPSGQQ